MSTNFHSLEFYFATQTDKNGNPKGVNDGHKFRKNWGNFKSSSHYKVLNRPKTGFKISINFIQFQLSGK